MVLIEQACSSFRSTLNVHSGKAGQSELNDTRTHAPSRDLLKSKTNPEVKQTIIMFRESAVINWKNQMRSREDGQNRINFDKHLVDEHSESSIDQVVKVTREPVAPPVASDTVVTAYFVALFMGSLTGIQLHI